jgi:hypothetical protein
MDSVLRDREPDMVISPELVLVDPELAEIARQRLRDAPARHPPPRLHVAPAVASARVEPRRAPAAPSMAIPRRRPVAAGAVGAFAVAIPVLLLGGVAVGMIASEMRAQFLDDPIAVVSPRAPTSTTSTIGRRASQPTTQPSASIVPAQPEPTPQLPRPSIRPSTVAPAARAPAPVPRANPAPTPRAAAPAGDDGRWIPTKSEVEVRTLMLLQERGAGSVPIALIDRSSGLIANNVHAVCRQVGETPRFDCRLGIGLGQGGEWLLTVVVAKDGSQTFTWRGHAPPR